METFYEMTTKLKASFISDYGSIKFDRISEKVAGSSKIQKLFETSRNMNLPPNQNDILNTLNTIPFFLFSKPESIGMGALLTLELWDSQVNRYKNIVPDEWLLMTGGLIMHNISNYKR